MGLDERNRRPLAGEDLVDLAPVGDDFFLGDIAPLNDDYFFLPRLLSPRFPDRRIYKNKRKSWSG